MEIPRELEARLVHVATECLKAADQDEYSLAIDTPTARFVIEIRLLPLPMESKDALRIVEESRPHWEPG